MKSILQKISDLYKRVCTTENLNKIKALWGKGRRYVYAVLLFALLVVILTQCTGKNRDNVPDTQSSEVGSETNFNVEDFEFDSQFSQDDNAELNTLITNYFTAYATDDLDALAAIAYPMTDNEKSYIGVFSQYIENYQNIKCYYKKGVTEGSYLVSVYYELKFYGVDTLAPGLDFFYVETNEDGGLFINNLYSSYNMGRTENELDANVYAVILKFEQQDDVIALLEQVETKYTEAVASDVNLATMISTTIPTAMTQWIESITQMEESQQGTEQTTEQTTEETPSESTTEDQPAENTTQQEQPQASENTGENTGDNTSEDTTQNTTQKVRTTAKVFVRSGPGKNYSEHGKAEAGTEFTKLGEEGDWIKVDYKGAEGYIRSDFLEDVTN